VGLAKKFNCDPRTVDRIWSRAKENFKNGGGFSAAPRKKGRCGRRAVYDQVKMAEAIRKLPVNERKTYCQIAEALGVSLWTVQQAVHGENCFLVHHTNAIKPFLTEQNKFGRVAFAME
jgi:hypothetical protein